MDYLVSRFRINVNQTVYDLFLFYGGRNNLRNILGLYPQITYFFRMNYYNRAPFTETVASSLSDFHLVAQSLLLDLFFKACGNLLAAGSVTGRP